MKPRQHISHSAERCETKFLPVIPDMHFIGVLSEIAWWRQKRDCLALDFATGAALIWLIVGVWGAQSTVLLAQTFSSPAPVERTNLLSFDLLGDGRIDLRYYEDRTVVTHFFGTKSERRRRILQTAAGAYFSGPSATRHPVYDGFVEIEKVEPGFVVNPEEGASETNLLTRGPQLYLIEETQSNSSVPTPWGTNSSFYLGVVFTAIDGIHAGWVHLVKTNDTWDLDGSAVHSVPRAPLAVGTYANPTSTPDVTTTTEYITANPVRIPFENDITMGRHRWTNHVDHSHGLRVDLRGRDDWEWLVKSLGDTNELAEIPPRTSLVLPSSMPGTEWRTNFAGLTVYNESVSDTGETNRSGVLAATASVFVGFRYASLGGWVHLSTPLGDWEVARSASAVGARELWLAPGDISTAINLDLDGDGRVDFIDREDRHEEYVSNPFTTGGKDYYANSSKVVEALAGAAFWRGSNTIFIPVDQIVLIGPGDTFTSGSVATFSFRTINFNRHFDGSLRADSWLGFRFTAADGVHYGWMQYRGNETSSTRTGIVFNIWPDEAISTGAASPGPLRIASAGSKVRLYWPATQPGTLERLETLAEGVWQAVSPKPSGEYLATIDAPLAFFRLRQGQ